MTVIAAALWLATVVLLGLTSAPILANLLVFIGLIVIPGAALSMALLPVSRFGGAARVVGSIAFGLALAILAAIVLDRTPIGLRWTPLLLAIAAVVGLAVLAGVGRRTGPLRLPSTVTGLTSRQLALLGLSALLAVGSFGIARVGAGATAPEDVTQLWMLPDAAGAVEIGVANRTDAVADFRLVLALDGKAIKEWPAIRLGPGEIWKGAPDAVIARGQLKASLYRSDLPGRPFREAFISLPAPGG